MKYIYALIVILLIPSCKRNVNDDCSYQLSNILKTDRFNKFINFDSLGVSYSPNYLLFQTLKFSKQNHHIDILDRKNYFEFLKANQKNNLIPFSDLILIEHYSSGEFVSNHKILVLKCSSDLKGFYFKTKIGKWYLINEFEPQKELFEKIFSGNIKDKYAKGNSMDNFSIFTEINSNEIPKSIEISEEYYLNLFQKISINSGFQTSSLTLPVCRSARSYNSSL